MTQKGKGKVGFVSLGCAKNLCDTEVMLHRLMEAGYEITPEETEADVVIINTCAFIESAKKEAIDNILDIAWLKEHGSLRGLVVAGCLSERYREQLLEEMPEIDAVIGVGSIDKIEEAVERAMNGGSETEKYCCLPDKDACALGGDRIVTTGEAFAYIKIAEGCNNRCSYCAIPGIRGGLRSRPIEDIVAEAQGLDEMGIKELIVIAQDTTVYGLDLYGEYALPKLLRAITENTQIPWIRILYCYPDKITEELVQEIRDNNRIVKYIDLPVQHISDKMLTAMNRHGDSACVRDAVRRLKEAVPDIVIRSTAIVGFPGEDEADFEALCRFISEGPFARFGAFPYSREEDTPAYSMEDQVDEKTKQERFDILMRHQLTVSEAFQQSLIGETVQVLCEGFDPVSESYFGRSFREAPEIDGKIWFSAAREVQEGEFVSVRITEAMDYDLVGEAQT
ncbi:MAG: 30S ribosomal protein S12 methylthiotransferase RimO [Clostridiales bacterium]|nr:30S ribosomal protein S12 methylthiotransferase RimO [Clostridiales bacterium]